MGEEVLFWVMSPFAVLGALGLVFARKAVHGALSLAVTMITLAVFYIAQEAPFLGVVQVVVYTGAIMMLFLFVIMLVGVESSDSRVETIRGQRGSAALAVLGVVLLLTTVTVRATLPDEPTGMAQATPDGNVAGIADLIFGTYVWAFEVVAALLITAAVGAMTLTHRERIFHRPSQRDQAIRRFREGRPEDAAGLPVPGVYARHNAVDTPALLPDGTPSEASINRVLVARGAARSSEEFSHRPTPGDIEAGTSETLSSAEGADQPEGETDEPAAAAPELGGDDDATGGERA
ncbi:NADH-quinone oxidoreductase subunit J [Jiangella asiatica]|uniref:NADH-quinone oxidoreductase subunit J n=1 Tax=Jiangella asiatica TaxID=2530372 RepID=A0A4R5D9S8_9ACTN|nr:NADH-quinone oxidoreductase subunit J [Jiangella asiatica]TDE10336.1 NADH-quinone oxidoreductase subunit J [Jiangella asiatica]